MPTCKDCKEYKDLHKTQRFIINELQTTLNKIYRNAKPSDTAEELIIVCDQAERVYRRLVEVFKMNTGSEFNKYIGRSAGELLGIKNTIKRIVKSIENQPLYRR